MGASTPSTVVKSASVSALPRWVDGEMRNGEPIASCSVAFARSESRSSVVGG